MIRKMRRHGAKMLWKVSTYEEIEGERKKKLNEGDSAKKLRPTFLHTSTIIHTNMPHTQLWFYTHVFFTAPTLLHTIVFTHKNCYTQTRLHMDVFTKVFLHRDSFTHKHFYTQTRLHANPFTHKLLYTQTLLHTTFWQRNTFTHKRFTHRPFRTQILLHTNTFTHNPFIATHWNLECWPVLQNFDFWI